MTEEEIAFIKSKVDKGEVAITFTDGEKMKAIIRFIFESEGEAACQIIETDRPEKYADISNYIVTRFSDIASVA